MAKFKVLKNNQIYMSWLGIYSHHLTDLTGEFFKSIATYCIFIALISVVITSWLYCIKNWETDVKSALDAFKIVFSALQCIGMYVSIGLKMIQIKILHLKLQKIVDESAEISFPSNLCNEMVLKMFSSFFSFYSDEDDAVNNIYWKSEEKSRMWTTFFGFSVLFNTSAFTAVLIYALCCMALGNYNTSSWYLLLNVILPFDKRQPIGWFMSWIMQVAMTLAYALCMTAITSYFMSCCFYIEAMSNHFDFIMNAIKTDVEQNQTEKIPMEIRRNHLKITNNLCKAIQFHTEVLE